jgi:hypothetical protein
MSVNVAEILRWRENESRSLRSFGLHCRVFHGAGSSADWPLRSLGGRLVCPGAFRLSTSSGVSQRDHVRVADLLLSRRLWLRAVANRRLYQFQQRFACL